jgi:hypothetical protein
MLVDVTILTEKEINVLRLHEELAAVLGVFLQGVSTATKPGRVTVHINDDTPLVARDAIPVVIEMHDPKMLTVEQRAAADRKAALEGLRKPWAAWSEADRTDFVRILAEEMGIIPEG